MTSTLLSSVNRIVTTFLRENNEDLVESWETNEIQSEMKKLLSSKQEKKVKDPNAPKKSKSAYIFFCSDARKEIKESDPDMSATDVTREVSNRWNALKESTDEDDIETVNRYKEMAEEDKLRYKEEKANYVAPDNLAVKKSRKARKDGPPKPKTAYMFFSQDERKNVVEENPDFSFAEIAKELGRRWSELKDEDKKRHNKYVEMAEQDKKRYNESKDNESDETKEEVQKPKPKAKAPQTKKEETKKAQPVKKVEEKPAPVKNAKKSAAPSKNNKK